MADRHTTFTVVLEREMREDEAEVLINAIRQLRGVANVVPEVSDPHDFWAKDRAKFEIIQKVIELVKSS